MAFRALDVVAIGREGRCTGMIDRSVEERLSCFGKLSWHTRTLKRSLYFNSIMFDLPLECFINFFSLSSILFRLILTRWFSRITTAAAAATQAIEKYPFLSLSLALVSLSRLLFLSGAQTPRECELICAELPSSSSSSYQMIPKAIDNLSSCTMIGYAHLHARHRNDLKAIIVLSARGERLWLLPREIRSIINWIVGLCRGPMVLISPKYMILLART